MTEVGGVQKRIKREFEDPITPEGTEIVTQSTAIRVQDLEQHQTANEKVTFVASVPVTNITTANTICNDTHDQFSSTQSPTILSTLPVSEGVIINIMYENYM